MFAKIIVAVGKIMLLLFVLLFIGLNLLYIYNINQNNFINRHNLMSVDEVSAYLHEELPVNATFLHQVITFTEAESIDCRPPEDISLGKYISCSPEVTNPAYYSSLPYPFVLLNTAWDNFAPPLSFITFRFRNDILVEIEVSFMQGYI